MTQADKAKGLVVSDVSHRFGDFVAADHVSLEVSPGEVHCLLGPSGSGKSTLLRLIAGLENVQQGTISIAGVEVASRQRHLNPEDRAVGFVFQDYALFPHLNVRRNVAFGMSGRRHRDRDRAAGALLEQVGMAEYAAAMPHTLSGGQQQRVALARALAREPVVMLLDEPFSGLDARLRGEVRRSTLKVLRASKVATLMVTHDPRESLLTGDVVSVIRAGRIEQTGSPLTVFHRSANRQVAETFGPVNCFEGVVKAGKLASTWGELPTPELADGSTVEILLRPGSVILSRDADRESDQKTAMAPVRGTIVNLQPAGALAVITVAVADREIEVQDLTRRGWQVGDEVLVTIAEEDVLIRASEP